MLRLFDRLNMTPAERRLVVIIGAVAVIVLNYWIIWPRFSDFRTISDEIAEMERKRSRYELEIARRPVYEATLKKLQAEGSVLPPGEERIQFRSDMERMARDIGLFVPSWGEVLPERGAGASTNAFFESIGLTLSRVSGTEQQFVDFLYGVGSANSTIRVRELTLTPGNFDQRAQGKTNLIATIKLVASVQKAVPNLPATGVPASTASATPTATTAPSAAAGGTASTTSKAPVAASNAPPARPLSVATNLTATAPSPKAIAPVTTNPLPARGRIGGRTNSPPVLTNRPAANS